ncbi:MAG: HRDC domain-containing protein [Victivallales bacterium]|nr:HRDC domain-containing protein [Victivallales bacterium]
MNYPFITTNEEFGAACLEARKQPVIGLDTEFVWTKTYYPQLGLLQMGWDCEHCYLVDTIAVTDSTPLAELLADANLLKVFHEASSDLPILMRWCHHQSIPHRVADTRIAAGFAGLTASMSLAKLILKQLHVVLEKTETRTNWLQRPLTQEQLEYAGDDVTRLPALFASLQLLMREYGNEEFFIEEMTKYEHPSFYEEIAPENYWQRVSRPAYLKFTHQDFAVLQQLSAWREKLGRAKNITRNRIVPDKVLSLAAVKHPYTAAEVGKLEGVANTPSMHYCREIAEIVTQAMHIPKEEWPQIFIPNIDQRLLRQCSERIQSLAAKRAEARHIDPILVSTRREADSLATHALNQEDTSHNPLLNGWRHELLAPAIDSICEDMSRLKRKK